MNASTRKLRIRMNQSKTKRPIALTFPLNLPSIHGVALLFLSMWVLVIGEAIDAQSYSFMRHRRSVLASTESNATSIVCVEPKMSNTGVLTLLYYYKVETTAAVKNDIPQTLKKLEAVILQQLALDLLPCTKYSYTSSVSRRRDSGNPDLGIMGFDSTPVDSVSANSICEPIVNPQNNCTVVNGAINILLTSLAPPDDVIRYNVLSSIQASMLDGVYTDVIPGLFLVEYEGPDIGSPQDTSGSSSTTTPSSTHSSITPTQVIILIFIVTIAVIAVGIFILTILFPKKKISAVCTRTEIEYTETHKDGDLAMDETGSATMKTVMNRKDFMHYHSEHKANPIRSNHGADDASVVVDRVPTSSMSVCSEHSAKTRKTGWNSRTEKTLT